MRNNIIKGIIRQLQDNLDGNNWLDESFKKKIEGIDEKLVFYRPIPEVHSVAELIGHITIWRTESMKKLQGIESSLTMESPENWRTNEELRKIGWQKLKSDLFSSQIDLINMIKNRTDKYLEQNHYAPGYSYHYIIEGLIHHDIYHLGQLGITLKLLGRT